MKIKCKDMPLFYNGTYHGVCEQDASKCEECILKHSVYHNKKFKEEAKKKEKQ